ncbi:MAG: hypothetical protein ACRCYQ_08420 [Nocardioides sp.]
MLNISGIQSLLLSIAGIATVWIGIRIIGSSKRAQMSETANTSLNAIIGIVFVAIGLGAVAIFGLGSDLLDLLFENGGSQNAPGGR